MFFNNKSTLEAVQAELENTKKQLQQTRDDLQQMTARYESEHADLEATRGQLNQTRNKLATTKNQAYDAETERQKIVDKYAPLIDKDAELEKKRQEIEGQRNRLSELSKKYADAYSTYTQLKNEINLYQDTLEVGSFGLYERQFSFETSEAYKSRIEINFNRQKELIKNDTAVVCHTEWSVGGSRAEGKKMTAQYKKLMLFAFNGECDSCIAKVKWNNALKAKERILKAFENINKLGASHQINLTREFLDLKFEELSLTYEYEQKKQDEKEEQRRIREQMRDEEKAQKELERAQREAEDEELRFRKALEKAKQELGSSPQGNVDVLNQQIKDLESKLQEAQDRKERAISLAQQTKVGHIYVISNIGSFGDEVYKIGMTRRLDPMDRVKELGDASVPFQFDVHAIIYSENAPQLEYELHRKFNDNRLNRINNRKEFFKISLQEIEIFVNQHTNAAIEFTKLAEAREYRETMTLLEKLKPAGEPRIETGLPSNLFA